MLGLLPPSSMAIFFMFTAAPWIERATRLDAAGQRDEVDVGAVGEGLADALARPEDEVDDAGRGARLLEQADQGDGRQGRDRGRLQDRRVAGGQGRGELPAHLQERVVPRPDEPAHPDRLVDDPAERGRVARVDEPAALLVGEVARSSGRRAPRRRCPSGSRAWPCPCSGSRGWRCRSWSRSSRSATRSSRAARSPVGVYGQSVSSKARRAAAMAAWTCSSVATSTSVTSEPSLGFTTGLQVPSPDATHAPSMYRLGTEDLGCAAGPDAPRAGAARMPGRRRRVNEASRRVG